MSGILDYANQMGLLLPQDAKRCFSVISDMLVAANSRFNLTAVTDPSEIEKRHFADSLALLSACDIPHGASLIDVGCGAGFPSLPIKTARRDVAVTFLDSTAKKLDFIKSVCEELNFDNVSFACGRAEELGRSATFREKFDVASARGVANLRVLAECVLPFCKVGGRALLLKGEKAEDEVADALSVIEKCGGRFDRIKTVKYADSMSRVVVIEKLFTTPLTFPRRWPQMTKGN